MSVSGDNYNESNINAIIKFLEEDMSNHIKQITRLNQSAIAYIDYEGFLAYVYDEIGKEYDGYRESKAQLKSYIEVRRENTLKGNIQDG